MGSVDRHALRLVDSGGVTVVEMVVVLECHRHHRAPLSRRAVMAVGDISSTRPSVPFLEAQAALVPEEHDPVAGGELANAALGF